MNYSLILIAFTLFALFLLIMGGLMQKVDDSARKIFKYTVDEKTLVKDEQYFINSYFENKNDQEWRTSLTTFILDGLNDDGENREEEDLYQYISSSVLALMYKELVDEQFYAPMHVIYAAQSVKSFHPSVVENVILPIHPDGSTVVHPLEFDRMYILFLILEDLFPESQNFDLLESALSTPYINSSFYNREFRMRYTFPSYINWVGGNSSMIVYNPFKEQSWIINGIPLGIDYQDLTMTKQFSFSSKDGYYGVWFVEFLHDSDSIIQLVMLHSREACKILITSEDNIKVFIKSHIQDKCKDFPNITVNRSSDELKMNNYYYIETKGQDLSLVYSSQNTHQSILKREGDIIYDLQTNVAIILKPNECIIYNNSSKEFSIQQNLLKQNIYDYNYIFSNYNLSLGEDYIDDLGKQKSKISNISYGNIVHGTTISKAYKFPKFNLSATSFIKSKEYPDVKNESSM